MKRKQVYRCYPLDHIRKAYGECQGRYNGDHSVSVELLCLNIPQIGYDNAQNGQEDDSDCDTSYEYQHNPKDDTGCRRVRNKPAEISHSASKPNHAHDEINESLPPVHKEL